MLVEAINGCEIATLGELDAILARLHAEGQTVFEMRMGLASILHLVHLAEAADGIVQVKARREDGALVGVSVTGYVHPVTSEVVKISPFREDQQRVEFHTIA